ncbi:MAG: acetyltransferase, partial [Halodesulfurarchaeum sp.]
MPDSRHERLTRYPTNGPGNSMWEWTRAKPPWTVARNYVAIVAARRSPSLRFKNWLYRRLGMSVGAGVSWGLEATPDVFY